jgi:hypothetical protein
MLLTFGEHGGFSSPINAHLFSRHDQQQVAGAGGESFKRSPVSQTADRCIGVAAAQQNAPSRLLDSRRAMLPAENRSQVPLDFRRDRVGIRIMKFTAATIRRGCHPLQGVFCKPLNGLGLQIHIAPATSIGNGLTVTWCDDCHRDQATVWVDVWVERI